MDLFGGKSKEKPLDNRNLYIIEEYDRPPVLRQTNARAFSLTTSANNAPKDVMDGPPFCMVTAARALYMSTLAYLESNARGLTEEKHGELHKQVENVGGEHGLDVVDMKEFYHREGKETIRCICYAGKKTKKKGDDVEGEDENEEKVEVSEEREESNEGAVKRSIVRSKHNRILIAFRGTDTVKNVIADIKTWTVPHPPARGSVLLQTKPMVHHGFLTAWHNDDLRKNVLDFVRKHVEDMRQDEIAEMEKSGDVDNPWPSILITGHSLGGAVATLATYDIASELKNMSDELTKDLSSAEKKDASVLSKPDKIPYSRDQLRLYTYGCPRVGNVPFAESVNELAPNSWNVIHDNDIVPAVPARLSTMFPPYMRVGRQVIIHDDGSFYINPDRKMRRTRELKVMKLDTSVASHETGNYRKGLLSVFEKEGLLEKEEKNEETNEAGEKDETKKLRHLPKSKASLQLAAESLKLLGDVISEARNDPNRSFRVLPGAT